MKNNWLKPGILLLVVMLALAACGQAGGTTNNGSASAGNDAANTAANEAAAPQNAEQPADNAAAEAGSDPSAVTHDANARIASVSIHITNNLLALGIKPAGSAIGGDVKDFLPHAADMLQGTAKLGVVTDPDMEAILGLKPDVIYVDEVYSGDDVSKFEKIAPTISINMDEGTWRDHLKQIAAHAGKEAEAEAFIAQYADKAKRVGELVHQKLGADAKVMAIRMTPKELRVMGTKRPLGPIMFEDLGLKMANGVEDIPADEPFQVISKEVLPDYDADAIFVIVSKGADAQKNFEELEQNAVWNNLKAVKNKHVYVLDGQKWLDYSALGQDMALDDAEKLFSE